MQLTQAAPEYMKVSWLSMRNKHVIVFVPNTEHLHVRSSARDVAAPAYSVLARSGFATLERLAGVDAKHADRFGSVAPGTGTNNAT